MVNTKRLPDEFLDSISGGKLPDGWEKIADQMAPSLMKEYPNITYEEACALVEAQVTDPEDLAAIKNYMKKYF